MIIQGGKSFFNKQNSQKKSSSSSSESKGFDELLMQARTKRKPSYTKKKSALVKKKDNHQDVADTDSKRNDQVDLNKKKLGKRVEARRERQRASQAVARRETASQKNQMSEKNGQAKANNTDVENKVSDKFLAMGEMQDMEQTQADKGALKNLDTSGNTEKNALSLNLSGVKNKTLEKNEKIISDIENQLLNIKNKFQVPTANGGTVTAKANGLAASLGNNSGKVKIDTSVNMEQSINNLSEGSGNGLAGLSVEGKQSQSSNLGEDTKDLDSMFSQALEQQDTTVQTGEESQFVEEMNQMNSQERTEKIENMQSIIKQARAFVDDGGGSMDIHLQPEGLGKVHLKVAVQDGQVNVEMHADNMAAKKALEEGLLDVKTALEGQKLLVETLKVEMSPDYQKDFSDLNNHMQEQANRDFAEQFLGQFKQEREERMGGMFDSFRNFQRGPKEPELVLNQRNPYTEKGKGRTLNLVA